MHYILPLMQTKHLKTFKVYLLNVKVYLFTQVFLLPRHLRGKYYSFYSTKFGRQLQCPELFYKYNLYLYNLSCRSCPVQILYLHLVVLKSSRKLKDEVFLLKLNKLFKTLLD